jgi:hypothetical protein
MFPAFNPTDTGPHIYWMGRLVGLVCLLAGLGLLALSAWGGLIIYLNPHSVPKELKILFGILYLLGLFLIFLGYRLVLCRPNRYQSVLPPWGWNMLTLGFVALTVSLFVSRIDKLNKDDMVGLFSSVCITAMCFKAGRVTALRGKTDSLTPGATH